MSRLRIFNSSLSRRDPVLRTSADIVNEVVKETYSLLLMHRDHVTVIKSGDWLEDFILEPIGPMLPRVVGTSFLCSIIQLINFLYLFFFFKYNFCLS